MGKLVIGVRPDLERQVHDKDLRREIADARRTGIAWNRGEIFRGVIAVAIWAGMPAPNAPMISVSWPEFRFAEGTALRVVAQIRQICASAASPGGNLIAFRDG
jgi:DNA-binding IclR family transcriptional regulator